MNTYSFPKKSDFITEISGQRTELIRLKNKNNLEVYLTNYGARIISIFVKDKAGNTVDVNLGHANIHEYTKQKANYYGAVIGRVCGRIRENHFEIDDKEFKLKPNNGTTFLHGGENAFHTKVFKIEHQAENSVLLSYFSKDGEEGFPGNLDFNINYKLSDDNELIISFEAAADKKTPFNVTHHAYFNLNGEGNGDILNHELQIFSNRYLPIREDILPTGEIADVKNTPFDFSKTKTIGRDIEDNDRQIQFGSGYDHSFVLSTSFDQEVKIAAVAKGDLSGIKMEVFTNQPAIHLYTGNFMDETFLLKNGERDKRRTAFCLETQHLADAMNQSHFPSVILEPNKKFVTTTIFKFSVE